MPSISRRMAQLNAGRRLPESPFLLQQQLHRMLHNLRIAGGQLYMAGPANNEFIDNSGAAPDGIGTDPIGYVRNLAAEELGPELLLRTSGESDASCTYTAGTDTVTANATPSCNGISLYVPPGLGAGAVLEVTYTLATISAGTCVPIMYGTGCFAVLTSRSSPGTYRERVILAAGGGFNNALRIRAGVATSSFVTTNHSVKEVRAAYQTTTAAKPKLVREPILGPELVVNGGFSAGTAGWSAGSATLAVTSGVATATTTTAGWATVSRSLRPAISVGKTYQASVLITPGTSGARLLVQREAAGGYAQIAVTGSATAGGAQQIKSTIFTAVASDCQVALEVVNTAIGQTVSFDNISVREILGYRDVWSWEFDGVDDRLQFVPPSNIAAGCVVCCATTRNFAGQGWAVSAGGTTNDQKFGLFQQYIGTSYQAIFTTGAGVAYATGGAETNYFLGETAIYTAWLDTAAGYLRLRKNGAQLGQVAVTGDLSTAFTSGAIGSRFNAGGPFSGKIQAPVIATGITTLAEIQTIERAVAAAAGITLP